MPCLLDTNKSTECKGFLVNIPVCIVPHSLCTVAAIWKAVQHSIASVVITVKAIVNLHRVRVVIIVSIAKRRNRKFIRQKAAHSTSLYQKSKVSYCRSTSTWYLLPVPVLDGTTTYVLRVYLVVRRVRTLVSRLLEYCAHVSFFQTY